METCFTKIVSSIPRRLVNELKNRLGESFKRKALDNKSRFPIHESLSVVSEILEKPCLDTRSLWNC